MKTFDRRKWEDIRLRGHSRFIITHGLINWGISSGLVTTLGPYVYDLVTYTQTPSMRSMVCSFLFTMLIFGYGMGDTEWRRNGRAYNENPS